MAQTGCVGCIANPMAGKDIRRLVAYGSRIDNQEKVNIVRRILLGLESAGIAEVLLMPDTFQIADKALEGIHQPLQLRMHILDMEVRGDAKDSLRAAQHTQQVEHLARKVALCEQAEALADSTDWIAAADALKALQAEWKTIGPAPRRDEQSAWDRFRTACNRFFTRRQEDLKQRKQVWTAVPT